MKERNENIHYCTVEFYVKIGNLKLMNLKDTRQDGYEFAYPSHKTHFKGNNACILSSNIGFLCQNSTSKTCVVRSNKQKLYKINMNRNALKGVFSYYDCQ